MAAFHFELVSPEKLLFSGSVDSVVVPGSEGEFTVLAQHAPTMAVLRVGVVKVDAGDGKLSQLFVGGGFADISAKGLTILAEKAIPVEELTAARFDADILTSEKEAASAITDEARRLANEKVGQLRDVRATLGL